MTPPRSAQRVVSAVLRRGSRSARPAAAIACLLFLSPAAAQSPAPAVRADPPAVVQVPRPPAALLQPPVREGRPVITAPAAPPAGSDGGAHQPAPAAAAPDPATPVTPPANNAAAAAGAAGEAAPFRPSRNWPRASAADALALTTGGPDADELIETDIVPVFDRLATSAVRLQNAVIRHCAVPSSISERSLRDSFDAAVRDSAAILPLAMGSPAGQNAPALLLTNVSSSVFSTSQLNAMMAGRRSAPRTLIALASLDNARPLMGLPALERLLIARDHTREETFENRCRLALVVSASIADTSRILRHHWRRRDLAPHWQGDTVELSDRLRLRDLVQGAINTVDRLNREARQYGQTPARNPALPFSSARIGKIYLGAVTAALGKHIARLRKFDPEGSAGEALLTEIELALEVGGTRLAEGRPGDGGGYVLAFSQAQADIIDRLPGVFAFDATAFDRVTSSFEPPPARQP